VDFRLRRHFGHHFSGFEPVELHACDANETPLLRQKIRHCRVNQLWHVPHRCVVQLIESLPRFVAVRSQPPSWNLTLKNPQACIGSRRPCQTFIPVVTVKEI
jgi:hypothetical protein